MDTLLRQSGKVVLTSLTYSDLHRAVTSLICLMLETSRNSIFLQPLGTVQKATSHLLPFLSFVAKTDLSDG